MRDLWLSVGISSLGVRNANLVLFQIQVLLSSPVAQNLRIDILKVIALIITKQLLRIRPKIKLNFLPGFLALGKSTTGFAASARSAPFPTKPAF
jgi:hypothetical protein